ncbi:MAG: hypothetical protein Q9188_004807 [Gyalolechia gomerana]
MIQVWQGQVVDIGQKMDALAQAVIDRTSRLRYRVNRSSHMVDRQFSCLDKQFIALQRVLNEQLGELNERIDNGFHDAIGNVEGLNESVAGMDGRFNDVEGKIDEVESKVDEVEETVLSRLNEVEDDMKGCFTEVIDKMECRHENTQAVTRNGLCRHGWERVRPIRIQHGPGLRPIPPFFPQTVRRFWNLKHPLKRDDLIHLLYYYDIRGYQDWGLEGEEVQDNGGWIWPDKYGNKSPSLKAAARLFPDVAHRALAAELGLDYDKIQACIERPQEREPARTSELLGETQSHQPSHRRKRPRAESTSASNNTDQPTEIAATKQRRTRAKAH